MSMRCLLLNSQIVAAAGPTRRALLAALRWASRAARPPRMQRRPTQVSILGPDSPVASVMYALASTMFYGACACLAGRLCSCSCVPLHEHKIVCATMWLRAYCSVLRDEISAVIATMMIVAILACAEDVRPAADGWILNVYAAAVTPEPASAPAPGNDI